jgi:hypothetical protein
MKIAKNIPRNLLLCCGAYYFSSAIVAIGHKILILAHYMLQHNTPFRELGAEYYQRLRAPSLSQSLVRRLQRLGFQVTLTPIQQVA